MFNFIYFAFQIIDDNENEVNPGVEGEIAVKRTAERMFGLFKGYKVCLKFDYLKH